MRADRDQLLTARTKKNELLSHFFINFKIQIEENILAELSIRVVHHHHLHNGSVRGGSDNINRASSSTLSLFALFAFLVCGVRHQPTTG